MLTDMQMGLLWCGILVLICFYVRQSPATGSPGVALGVGTAVAAAPAVAAGQPLSDDEVSLPIAHAVRGKHLCLAPHLHCLLPSLFPAELAVPAAHCATIRTAYSLVNVA